MAIRSAIEISGSWKQIHNPISGVVPWRDPVSRILLAEMRDHPGGSAQQRAMFATVPTGRLAPNRYY